MNSLKFVFLKLEERIYGAEKIKGDEQCWGGWERRKKYETHHPWTIEIHCAIALHLYILNGLRRLLLIKLHFKEFF